MTRHVFFQQITLTFFTKKHVVDTHYKHLAQALIIRIYNRFRGEILSIITCYALLSTATPLFWQTKCLPSIKTFLCPATKKVAGYYVIPSEILSVRLSVCLSVSAPTILLPTTPPTVLGQSFSNFAGAFRTVWRYAYCFFRILKLFFIIFFAFLT